MKPHELDKMHTQLIIIGLTAFVFMYACGLYNIFRAQPSYGYAIVDFAIGTVNLVILLYNTQRKYK